MPRRSSNKEAFPFVHVGSNELLQSRRKVPPKLFHKKSRTGCKLCRARRVKCNEAKPVCHHCQRLGQPCEYDRGKPEEDHVASQESQSPNMDGAQGHQPNALPESEFRRRLELKLLSHYCTATGPSISSDDVAYEAWVNATCRMANNYDALLYCVYLVSGLHMEKQGHLSDEESKFMSTYLDLTLRLHHEDVSNMSEDSADAVCMTSNLLRMYSLAKLQDRKIDPYEPPTQWLRMGESSSMVYKEAKDLKGDDPKSLTVKLMQHLANILYGQGGHAQSTDFVHLLRREEDYELEEGWEGDVEVAYESTIGYIGGTWKSIMSNEPDSSVTRKLAAFPLLVHKGFIDMVEERRPRALVILAHYFALLTTLRHSWWVGDAGAREVEAIASAVPGQYNLPNRTRTISARI